MTKLEELRAAIIAAVVADDAYDIDAAEAARDEAEADRYAAAYDALVAAKAAVGPALVAYQAELKKTKENNND